MENISSNLVMIQGEMYRYAFSLTADEDRANDLLQETSLRALTNADKFISNTNFKGWITTIMKNIHINDYRREKRANECRLDDSIRALNSDACSYEEKLSKYDFMIMREAIQKLPERYRIPFSMFATGYSYIEIAEYMGTPIGTVKSRIFEARKNLQGRLKVLL